MTTTEWEDDGVYVVGVGAQTPVGRTALRAAAAVRCGISAYQEHPFMMDRYGEPMVVAPADWLPIAATAVDRAIQLGADALLDVLQCAPWLSRSRTLPLAIAMSKDNFATAQDQGRILQGIQSAVSQQGYAVAGEVLAEGNAVGVVAIQHAIDQLRTANRSVALVLGVDSYLGPQQLESVDYSGRLHSINNSWGFTPGEGAGAMLITTGRIVSQLGLTPLAHIAAVAVGSESKLLGTKTVCIGEGLTAAFRGVLSESDKVCHSYCDLNGETYRADEFGFAVCRTGEGFLDAGSFNAGAECWGDVGAASVPLEVALATSAWARGYAKGSTVLCWSSSTTAPLRGAIRLRNTWQPTEE